MSISESFSLAMDESNALSLATQWPLLCACRAFLDSIFSPAIRNVLHCCFALLYVRVLGLLCLTAPPPPLSTFQRTGTSYCLRANQEILTQLPRFGRAAGLTQRRWERGAGMATRKRVRFPFPFPSSMRFLDANGIAWLDAGQFFAVCDVGHGVTVPGVHVSASVAIAKSPDKSACTCPVLYWHCGKESTQG